MSPPDPLPPATADCVTVTKLSQPGAAPQQSASRVFRSPDGKIRVDTGNTSVITDMAAQQTTIIDHLKQEAQVFPMPQTPPPPPMPGAPAGMPGMHPPAMQPPTVQDLGKGFIEGHEVEGKRYIMQPPQMPEVPKPALPQMAKPPGIPGAPKPPDMPQAPPPPTVSEVWSSTKLKMPVLTKTTGSFGERVEHCKCSEMPHPDPAMFQVPPGYKVVPPKVPQLPAMPAAPKPPEMPKPPSLPK